MAVARKGLPMTADESEDTVLRERSRQFLAQKERKVLPQKGNLSCPCDETNRALRQKRGEVDQVVAALVVEQDAHRPSSSTV